MIYGEKFKLKLANYYARRLQEETPEANLKIVRKNVQGLQFIKDQTPELCSEAIKHNAKALKYVKNQDVDLCLEAVKKDPQAIEYIKFKELSPEDAEYLKLIFS